MIGPFVHVSFDLDGTLVHTRPEYRHEIVPAVLAELGGSSDPEAVDAFWFEGNRSKTIRERFGVDPDLFWERFQARDTAESRSRQTFAYPDAASTINALRAMGKTVSIITGAPLWIAEMETAKLEGAQVHHTFAIKTSGFAEKPCPDSMHHVLRHLGHGAHETLYVGNGIEDAQFAEAAGCDFVLIDRGECIVRSSKTYRTIASLSELFQDQ